MKVIIERTLCELDLKYDDEENKLEFVVTDLETDNNEPWSDYDLNWENNFESYEEAKEFYLDADWVDELGYLNTKLSIIAIDEELLLVSSELKEEFEKMYELLGANISGSNHETVFLDQKYIEMIDEPVILAIISGKYEFQEWFSNENFSQIQEIIIRKNIKNKNKTVSVNITQVDEYAEYKYIKTENYSIFVKLYE